MKNDVNSILATNFGGRILSLAGAVQAAQTCLWFCKRGGQISPAEILHDESVCLNSLLIFHPETAEDVYAEGVTGLQRGIKTLVSVCEGQMEQHFEIMSCVQSMMRIEKLLAEEPEMLKILQLRLSDLQTVSPQADAGELQKFCSEVDSVYRATLSRLKRRIPLKISKIAHGDKNLVPRIRTLLLAGVRSIVLWHQCGGRLWRLFFERQKIANTGRLLLSSTK